MKVDTDIFVRVGATRCLYNRRTEQQYSLARRKSLHPDYRRRHETDCKEGDLEGGLGTDRRKTGINLYEL